MQQRRLFIGALIFVSIMCALSATAQTVGDIKILVPLVVERGVIPGGFGSQWTTRISILNTANHDVVLEGFDKYVCQFLCAQPTTIPPGITFYPVYPFLDRRTDEVEGLFLFTTAEDLPFIDVTLHVQDVSRQALTWGTEIPVVPETAAFTASSHLGDIPIGARFRSRLRVYDFDPAFQKNAKVAYSVYKVDKSIASPFDANGTPRVDKDELLATSELTFRYTILGLGLGLPGYAEIGIETIPFSGVDRIRIRLDPITPGLRYWTFVSVTNNETQHVTTVTPR